MRKVHPMPWRKRLTAAERAQSEAMAEALRERRLAASGACANCPHLEGWHTAAGCRAFKCTCTAFAPTTT
jgi:hypothetical protein